jgi:cell wall-associated NlpC family hydrolase
MQQIPLIRAGLCAVLCGFFVLASPILRAEDTPPAEAPAAPSFFERATNGVDTLLGEALGLIGVPYKRGGNSPERGFDCSGFVSHVYERSLGLILPHNAKAMSSEGEKVDKQELQPGDLVFFNTMRRAFSHVGIYVGDGLFVHSPRSGGKVRVEEINDSYWRKRYNGARRVAQD